MTIAPCLQMAAVSRMRGMRCFRHRNTPRTLTAMTWVWVKFVELQTQFYKHNCWVAAEAHIHGGNGGTQAWEEGRGLCCQHQVEAQPLTNSTMQKVDCLAHLPRQQFVSSCSLINTQA